MSKKRKLLLGVTAFIILLSIFSFIVFQSSMISRQPFGAPEAAYDNWEDFLSNPQPITVQSYSTGTMQTKLSGIMNLDHEQAQDIEDVLIDLPVNVSVIQHKEFGAYLIDAGLDSSYTENPNGTIRGIMVKRYLGKGTQEPDTHIAAILNAENIQIQGVFLTHLHFDHTAGVLDLPKDIPYVVGKGDLYPNFRFFTHSDHLSGIDRLYEIDFAEGIDLSPLGKGVDVFGDGSLWAISSTGHSKGHVMFFINGIDEQVLLTGDACNTLLQFESGIGPGFFSNNIEDAQEVLDQIILFKQLYPEIRLVFGHDLKSK